MTYTATFHETDRRVYDGMEIGMRDPDADLLHLAIMTDPHVPYTSAWGSFNGKLCADVYANRLQDAINRGAEAVLVTGDLTAESRQSEYDLYHETVAGFADRLEIIESIGNHEHRYEGGGAANRRNQLKNIFAPRWRANMDTGLYFSQWVGNTHIIALGNDYYGPNGGGAWDRSKGQMTTAQINWFENLVKEDYKNNVTTIVMCHWPIKDTTQGSGEQWSTLTSEQRVKDIVSTYDNVILFSGHTHGNVGAELPVYRSESGGMFVHAGRIRNAPPVYVTMDEVATTDGSRKYELRYIFANSVSETFTFQHKEKNTIYYVETTAVYMADGSCFNLDACYDAEEEVYRLPSGCAIDALGTTVLADDANNAVTVDLTGGAAVNVTADGAGTVVAMGEKELFAGAGTTVLIAPVGAVSLNHGTENQIDYSPNGAYITYSGVPGGFWYVVPKPYDELSAEQRSALKSFGL